MVHEQKIMKLSFSSVGLMVCLNCYLYTGRDIKHEKKETLIGKLDGQRRGFFGYALGPILEDYRSYF